MPPLFMITVMPRAMPMIRATPSRSRAPFDERVGELDLAHPPDQPDDDREQDERGRSSPGTTTTGWGSPMPMSSQGMTPYIITHEREPERRPGSTFWRPVMATAVALSSATLKCSSLASLMSCDHRAAWVLLDPVGVAHARRRCPIARPTIRMISRDRRPSLIEIAGEPGGDAGGEGVDRRAEGADPAARAGRSPPRSGRRTRRRSSPR